MTTALTGFLFQFCLPETAAPCFLRLDGGRPRLTHPQLFRLAGGANRLSGVLNIGLRKGEEWFQENSKPFSAWCMDHRNHVTAITADARAVSSLCPKAIRKALHVPFLFPI